MTEDTGPADAPAPPKAARPPQSVQEAEAMLLTRLAQCERAWQETVLELALFYSQTGRQEVALTHFRRLLAATDDPELQARHLLSMGMLLEQLHHYQAAVACYTQGLALEVGDRGVRYLFHNNLGFCLNQFGRHAEAEPLCRTAIELDPDRHNAYKNLGVALEGQAEYAPAVECYVQAVRRNPADPRALHHLEKLVAEHREVAADLPEIEAILAQCRTLVEAAQRVH